MHSTSTQWIPLLLTITLVTLFSCEIHDSTETASGEPVTTLYHNGDIITMDASEITYAEAVVERSGTIAFVGSKKEALKK